MNATRLANPYVLSCSPVEARRELQSLLETTEWPGDVDSVVLAVHEALINAQRHAGGPTSAVAGIDGPHVVVEVCDGGPGFAVEPHAHERPDAMAEHGRGLWLISQIAASYELRRRDDQNCLCLHFRP